MSDAPRPRGRPREIEGEQERITIRAGELQQRAIALYRLAHPNAGKAEAVREIIGEWLTGQGVGRAPRRPRPRT